MLTTHVKQPPALIVFFMTEMWERFGFYVVQSLLVLYMTSSVFGFSDTKSYAILGAFTALSYLMPLLGGYAANRILDFEHAVILGGVLLSIGYALLALPYEHLFFISLAIITIGTGFFKPSISSYLGSFYDANAPHREKGYTIFYVGINVGILLSTAISGYLVRFGWQAISGYLVHFGWHMPFLIACIGILVGTATFFFGLAFLKRTHRFQRITASVAQKKPWMIVCVYLGTVVFCGLSYIIIRHDVIANTLMLWSGLLLLIGLTWYACLFPSVVRNKMIACIILTLFSVVFWALYFQMFFSMSLFIDRVINRHFFSSILPTPLFISLESIYIILLGPLLGMLWYRLTRKNKNVSVAMKFSLSLFFVFIAFFIVYYGTKFTDAHLQSDKLFIVFAYLFIAIGELLLSPIGLSMVTVLVPREMVGLMMGVFFSSLGFGAKLSGMIANYAAIPKHISSLEQMQVIYGHAFFIFAGLSLVAACIALVMTPFLNKLIRDL